MRIAFHAINGVGLGHIARVAALAQEIRRILPRAQILVLTNSARPELLLSEGIDVVRLPPRLIEPHADPSRVGRALPEPMEDAALKAALDVFRPHLMVFDTHAPAAVAQHAGSLGARCVLVLRELRPEAFAHFLAGAGPALFDRMVVPHPPDEVNLRQVRSIFPLVRTGLVVRPLATDLPEDLVLPEGRPLVLAVAGGAGQPVDARRYLRAVVDAHTLARVRIPELQTLLVLGPFANAPDYATAVPGLTVMAATPHLPALMARADLVVSQAGYNAVAELRLLQKPAILVPGQRKAEDQSARAKRLVRMGLAHMAKPEARALANAFERVLLRPAVVAAMTAAHRAQPVVAKNRTTAQAILRTVRARRTVKRVVLVAHDFPPKRGGMETVAHDLAVGLHRAGVRVRVYTSKRLGAPLPDLPRHAVRSLFASGPAGVPIDLWGDLLLTLDALLVDRPDVVHLCHAGLAPWVPALRAALPIAVTVHVHGNDLVAPWVHHGGDADAYGRAQIQGLAQSDAVFAVSDFSAGLARDRQVPAARIAVVENGVDTERFSPRPFDRDLADRHGIAADDELVLCVSRLAPRKGHSVALTAMAEVMKQRPRALFAFTGDHPRMLADLLGLADELGIRDRVRALGAVTNDDLPGLYALARVVVLLSDQVNKDDVEGFGVTLLEAAASGVATVASRSGGMPEAVDDGVTGLLVDAGDPLSAAQAITTLLADPDRTRRMGAAGRARVLARFDSNARTERMLDHWRSIATSKPRGPRGSLEEFRQAFAGPAPEAGSVRDQLAHAAHGVALVRLAQIHAAHQRKQAHERRASFARIVQNGGTVRLRANTAGARWLPDALADCAALKHQPALDTRLRRFLEPDFLACAVPQLSAVHLSHSVPAPGHDVLLARVRALPATALAKIAGFRMFLSDEARGSDEIARSAVPQTQALRRTLAAHGVTAVPPPELMRYLSETPAGGPSTAMIEPTNFCNLACPTCPAGTGKIKPAPPMPVDHYDKALAALAGPLKTLALWNYGEPLLHPDLATLIARAKAARVATVKISTNAHFLEAHRAQALLHAGLDVLIVSVDGASADSYATFRKDGSFEQVAHNIAHFCAEKKRLGQLRPRVELQFIVMRHNEHELPEIRRLAAVWGVDRLRIKTVGAEDETRALVPTAALLSRYRGDARTPNTRHAFCAMAWDHTVINVDGSVTPCCYLRPDMGDAFVMGNVFSTPFPAIWRGQRYRAFRAAMLAGREHMPVCNRCRGGTHDLFVANEEVAAP